MQILTHGSFYNLPNLLQIANTAVSNHANIDSRVILQFTQSVTDCQYCSMQSCKYLLKGDSTIYPICYRLPILQYPIMQILTQGYLYNLPNLLQIANTAVS